MYLPKYIKTDITFYEVLIKTVCAVFLRHGVVISQINTRKTGNNNRDAITRPSLTPKVMFYCNQLAIPLIRVIVLLNIEHGFSNKTGKNLQFYLISYIYIYKII